MGKLIFLLISFLALSKASPKYRRQASEQKCGVRNVEGIKNPEIEVSQEKLDNADAPTRWFSVGIFKVKLGYKSHDLLYIFITWFILTNSN